MKCPGGSLAVLFFLLAVSLSAQVPLRLEPEAVPTPAPPPLLEIFEPRMGGANLAQMGFDLRHPLLVVQTVREIQLARDGKGVLLLLQPEDAKTFSKVSTEFNGRPLIFRTAGGVARPITINGAVDDGRLGFKHPEAAPLADDLRRTLHLGEFADK